MRYVRMVTLLAVLTTLPFGLTGCISQLLNEGGFIEFFLRGIGVGGAVGKAQKIKESVPVQFTGSIGGLNGTFDVSVGSYGTLTGTATIKGQKKAKLKLKDDQQAASLVKAMVLDVAGAEIDITKTKTVFKGSQTTGGVMKKYKCRIAWKGTILTGAGAGQPVRGRLKAKGSFE